MLHSSFQSETADGIDPIPSCLLDVRHNLDARVYQSCDDLVHDVKRFFDEVCSSEFCGSRLLTVKETSIRVSEQLELMVLLHTHAGRRMDALPRLADRRFARYRAVMGT
jgi:hypothetical protein